MKHERKYAVKTFDMKSWNEMEVTNVLNGAAQQGYVVHQVKEWQKSGKLVFILEKLTKQD